MADHHRQSLSPRTALRAQLLGSELDSGRGSLPQRTLLLSAQDPRGQLLAPGICRQADQPGPEVISNKWHTTILPAFRRSAASRDTVFGLRALELSRLFAPGPTPRCLPPSTNRCPVSSGSPA